MSDNGDPLQEMLHGAGSDSEHGIAPPTAASPSKRIHVRSMAKRTMQKTKSVLNLDDTPDSRPGSEIEEGDLFADPAFNPSIILNGEPAQPRLPPATNTKGKLKAASDAIAHPRRTIRNKVTRTAAGKISTVQRPFLSGNHDRDLLAAHDELNEAISSHSSAYGGESTGWESDEYQARQKVEKIEEARENAKIAWAIGRHVQRVKVVGKMPHRPREQDFVEKNSSGQETFRWDIWIAKLALYYTQGFTAQYIDDFEEPVFDIQDFARIVERISMSSAPWQAWLIDVRRVYTWEDPERTSKWMILFWTLWYTEHIMGFLYAYIIYTVLRNWFYPDSVEAVRQAYARSVDQALKAQAWGELVEKAGHEDWIEPLLDALGPMVQLQLADAADYLEVLTNFYKWASPQKTAASLWFFSVCLLITLVADMAFCMKIIWFIIGGSFFFTYPIATRFPQYRRLLSAWRWFVWDIPTDAEWSIRKLQEKALVWQADVCPVREEPAYKRQHSDSPSDYSTPESSPTLLPARIARESWKFHVYQGAKSGYLVITRKSMTFKLGPTPWRIPFVRLVEMRKTQAAKKMKVRALKSHLEAIEFCYLDEGGTEHCEVLSMAGDIRHEIFSLVLGISGLRWRALQIERHNKAGDVNNSHLDRIFK
jgi:hypothetical protein